MQNVYLHFPVQNMYTSTVLVGQKVGPRETGAALRHVLQHISKNNIVPKHYIVRSHMCS